jgi:hypothetical protein
MPKKISIVFSLLLITLICFFVYVLVIKKPSPILGEVEVQATSTEYRNVEYGFTLALPLSWKGYGVVNDTWSASPLTRPEGEVPNEVGALLYVRNPLWSPAVPRQDIPIMVFTLAQWDMIVSDKIHVGAAPINPSELGRNAKYVFALPARYNFAYLAGYEEVDQIIQSKPLRGF